MSSVIGYIIGGRRLLVIGVVGAVIVTGITVAIVLLVKGASDKKH